MIFVSGVDPHLIGMSVQELIDLTEQCISGAVAMPVDLDGDLIPDVIYDDLSAALTVFNQNFDNGTVNNQHLAVP
jgi:hypothetical protein